MGWFKLGEIVAVTGIPYQTLSRYANRHSHHLRLKREHKYLYIHEDSLPVLEKIRHLYQTGLTEKAVDSELTLQGIPITIEVASSHEGENEITTMSITLRSMESSIKSLHEKLENQENFNKLLVQQLDKQQKIIDSMNMNLEQQEQQNESLMTAVQEVKEFTEQLALSQNKKKWWQFGK